MQVQDIAEMNSEFFNYMVASEESEAGEGWAYNSWLDDLYAGKSTPEVLTANCKGFIKAYTDNYGSQDNDQTLSWLDLSYLAEYKTAFEALAAKWSGKASSLRSAAKDKVKSYADMWMSYNDYYQYVNYYGYPSSWFSQDSSYYCMHGYYEYAIFDVVDFLTQLKTNSTFKSYANDIQGVLDILNNLIGDSEKGNGAGNSNGLCVVLPIDLDYFEYESSETNFSTWRNLVG